MAEGKISRFSETENKSEKEYTKNKTENIDIVNIGNMHFSEGKKSISEKVYVDDKDLDDLNYIKSKVKEIYIRDTPNSKKEKF